MPLSRTNLLGQETAGTFGTGDFTTNAISVGASSLVVVIASLIENNGSTTDPTSAFTLTDSGGHTWTAVPGASAVVSPTSFPTLTKAWVAQFVGAATVTLKLSTGGRNIGEYSVSVVAYSGYDTVNPTAAVASGSNAAPGAAPNPVSITLNGTPQASSEVFAGVGANRSTAGVTPGSTFTEVDDLENTGWGGLETEARTGSTSTSVDWTDIRAGGGALFNWTAVAVEIRASSLVTLFTSAVAGEPEVGWSAGEPSVGWEAGEPSVGWEAGAPDVQTISAAAAIYVRVPVVAFDETGAVRDPTADVVAVGFGSTSAAPATFTTAAWVTQTVAGVKTYKARVLLAAGALAPGVYTVWVKITDNPEVPVIPAGKINVV